VYAAMLEDCLGLEAKPIVGAGFKPLEVFKKG